MARSPKPSSTDDQNSKPKKRLAPGEREARIIEEATQFFAEFGFRASTRDLARRMGVTQALLYRYFPSKEALINRVFEQRMSAWDPAVTEALLAATPSLEERLIAFYQRFAARSSYHGVRLFLRAELDEQRYADRYTLPLNERILQPVVLALRRESGLSGFDKAPFRRGERELAMTLHGAIAHLGFRKNLYNSPLPDDLGDHVAFYVRQFLAGAPIMLKRIHAGETDQDMQTVLSAGPHNSDRPRE